MRWRCGTRGPFKAGKRRDRLEPSRILLWKGHCAVHQRFLPGHVDQVRAKYPGIQVIVHPECRFEVCQKADALGSTEQLIALVEQAPAGSTFAIGTEIHLVNRLARRFAAEGKKIITLDDTGCLCTTMYRISPQHLAWALENLVEGGWSTGSRSAPASSGGRAWLSTACWRFELAEDGAAPGGMSCEECRDCVRSLRMAFRGGWTGRGKSDLFT